MEKSRLRQLLADIEVVLRAIRSEVVSSAGSIKVAYKRDGSEQTDMDVHVEQEVFKHVQKAYDEVTFYGEETGYDLPLPELTCLLDPIDGTKSYVEGVEGYTAMAVVIYKGEAIGSLIYRYIDDTVFTAVKGDGAYKNGAKIDLSTVKMPQKLYCRERMIPKVQQLPGLAEFNIEKGPTGAGHGFALVAEGIIAARINAPHSIGGGGYIHDYAPGTLLVAEAGGSVLPFAGDKYDITNFSFVACHPDLETTIQSCRTNLAQIEVDTLS